MHSFLSQQRLLLLLLPRRNCSSTGQLLFTQRSTRSVVTDVGALFLSLFPLPMAHVIGPVTTGQMDRWGFWVALACFAFYHLPSTSAS